MESEGGQDVDEGGGAIEVPHAQLPPETLRSVVESFVLREGTDYGERDRSFESKVADVMRQLERREAVIMYDPESDSVGIVTSRPSR
jgi:hypothetical protein